MALARATAISAPPWVIAARHGRALRPGNQTTETPVGDESTVTWPSALTLDVGPWLEMHTPSLATCVAGG